MKMYLKPTTRALNNMRFASHPKGSSGNTVWMMVDIKERIALKCYITSMCPLYQLGYIL